MSPDELRELEPRLADAPDEWLWEQIHQGAYAPIGPRVLPGGLDDLPVFKGDEVAAYAELVADEGDDIVAHFSSLAPPYDHFWIDFDRRRDIATRMINGWGWLCHLDPDLHGITVVDPSNGAELHTGAARWHLLADLFIEVDRKRQVGPIWRYIIPLAEDGSLLRHESGNPAWTGICPRHDWSTALPPDDPGFTEQFAGATAGLFLPAGLTISLLHCRNVETSIEDPPEKVSRKFEKRHGVPLTRYVELHIEPMRQLLDEAGANSTGLRYALHQCRGHFKTFGQDAPLFGRFTGTWWWGPHVRGSVSEGQVLKDYRVTPSGLGDDWEDEPETMPSAPSVADPDDPDRAGRGRVVHAQTVNALAAEIRAAGLAPRQAVSEEPDYDVAFVGSDGTPWVVEVKSITDDNEEHQLRLGLGQVLRYRQRLAAQGHDGVRPVLAASRPVTDPTWVTGCETIDGVLVVDPTNWRSKLSLDV